MKQTNLKHLVWLVLLILGTIAIAQSARAAPVGTGFTYQGRLTNAGGPVNGLHDLRFRLYDNLTAGAPVGAFVCVDNISVIGGLFAIPLDFGAQFAGEERFLEIEVRTDTGLNCGNPAAFAVLSPRQVITPSPHALFALNASTAASATTAVNATNATNAVNATSATTATNATQLNAQPAAFYQNASNQTSGTLNSLRLTVPLSLSGSSGAGIIYGVNTSSTGIVPSGVYGEATASSGAGRGVTGQSASTGGIGVFGAVNSATGETSGVSGLSASTAGRGVIGQATAGTGLAYGVLGLSSSTSGTGVVGQALATGVRGVASAATGSTEGVQGETSSVSGTGVRGLANGNTGFNFGVEGLSFSSNGTGVQGRSFALTGATHGMQGVTYSSSDNSVGVFGVAAGDNGITFGGRFESYSPSGIGAFGFATATTGTTYGVYGRSDGTSGRGVLGYATTTTGFAYGVVGQTAPPHIGYAVYANGDMGASGLKPFRIDHPDDPENKYLLHYAAESPDVINFYSGKATLNGAGEAVVELPNYFARINRDPRYTLTAVGAPMPLLHVAREIDEAALVAGAKADPDEVATHCSFRIAGGAPGGKVSWRVEALRNDRWVRQRGAPVEVEKQGPEKGTYQHPELYNQPSEKGMNYDAPHDPPEPIREESAAAAVSDGTND